MAYIFDFRDTQDYERWLCDPKNRPVLQIQTQLILDLLRPAAGETLLDIGCGSGYHLATFLDRHLQVTGLDASPYMLDLAAKRVGNRAELHRGVAEDLPFEDNSFHHACLITTLEFTEHPEKALEEAFRVTKYRVVLGILNRYALKGVLRRIRGIFTRTVYNRARFFSIWEIKRMAHTLLGDVPIAWKTACEIPGRSSWAGRWEGSRIIQRCPFGAFAAISVTLTPRFRVRPLPLEYRSKQTISPLAG